MLAHVHHPVAVFISFLWFAAVMSALVDNVPMALSMAYLIKEIRLVPGAPAGRHPRVGLADRLLMAAI